MESWPENLGIGPLPDFGAGISHRDQPCTPRELFCSLFVEPEEHVHFLKPAFQFALGALHNAVPPALTTDDPLAYLDGLLTWAKRTLEAPSFEGHAASWPARVVREYAPTGLTDGAWLRGSMGANMVETDVGMWLLKQMMIRFGDPGSKEPYVQRYAALLRSVGIPPDAISRWDFDEAAACSELSYEHALLGLTIGAFPSALAPETLGFNLWMAAIGPCPLLERLAEPLRAQGACLRYLDMHERDVMAELAVQGIYQFLVEQDDAHTLTRIGRGFTAAHDSYLRWQRGVFGANSPFRAHDFALESQRIKARFGDSSEGPAIERNPIPLQGVYTPPQDPEQLAAYAFDAYAPLSFAQLYHRFANSDCYPSITLFGKAFVHGVLAKLAAAFDGDPRLNSQLPPRYSERTIAEIVAAQHDKNVRSRKPAHEELLGPGDSEDGPAEYIGAIFDGCWLQGFADVRRADFEEYGWLFRIYASEHGDGDMEWNHSRIFRREFAPLGPDVMLPKTDPRLYELFEVGVGSVAKLAIALNTRHFMPEILGMNLGIEASGVGGTYLERWKRAEGKGLKWEALAARLHNSIDNYADGHTKWSLSAVQAFMRRVKDAAPSETGALWHRIWRLWRLQDILSHGSESEQAALAEHLQLRSLAPT
jgi:hypothetical protein